jgi:hypothetical protein
MEAAEATTPAPVRVGGEYVSEPNPEPRPDPSGNGNVRAAAQPAPSGLATVDGRVKCLKGVARKLERRISDTYTNGAAFNTEAKELRETLKQIAAELEGRGDLSSQESALERIRQILEEES